MPVFPEPVIRQIFRVVMGDIKHKGCLCLDFKNQQLYVGFVIVIALQLFAFELHISP